MPLRMGTRSQRQNLLTTSGDYTTVGQLLQADPSLGTPDRSREVNYEFKNKAAARYARHFGYGPGDAEARDGHTFSSAAMRASATPYFGFMGGEAGKAANLYGSTLGLAKIFSPAHHLEKSIFGSFFGSKAKPVSPGFAVARAASGLQGKYGRDIRTILGGDPEHVFKEKRRLNAQIAANPFAAAALFGTGRQAFFGGGSFSGKLGTMRGLISKASAGSLSDMEKRFIEEQAEFGSRHGAFNRLLGRQAGIIAQRENVEAFRRRQPGRTQTILTTSR